MAAALAIHEGGDKGYHEAKIALALFYADNYLTEAVSLTDVVTAGAGPLGRIDPAALSA